MLLWINIGVSTSHTDIYINDTYLQIIVIIILICILIICLYLMSLYLKYYLFPNICCSCLYSLPIGIHIIHIVCNQSCYNQNYQCYFDILVLEMSPAVAMAIVVESNAFVFVLALHLPAACIVMRL